MKSIYAAIGCALLILGCAITPQREKQRIFYVNSYHQGYAPSDSITEAIRRNLPVDSFELKIFYLDSKRTNDTMQLSRCRDMIAHFNPHGLIVSDDYAVKELVLPHYAGTTLPVIFCGVNWDCSQYGLPTANVSGMLEVLPLRETLSVVKQSNPEASRLMVLSENSLSEQNNSRLLDTLYRNSGFEVCYRLVADFEAWKQAFAQGNTTCDLIYLPTNGSIAGWNDNAVLTFVDSVIRVPVVTCDDFMMRFAVFGLTKVPAEQGEWAAKTMKNILSGAGNISRQPVNRNRLHQVWLNQHLAARTAFRLPDSLRQRVINVD